MRATIIALVTIVLSYMAVSTIVFAGTGSDCSTSTTKRGHI